MKSRLITALAGVLVAMLGVAGAQAQVKTDPGVARISMIHGDVSTQRGDSGDWSAAALNAPVVSGDRISTGDQSRVEVQLDYANILRLAQQSQANITGLTRTQIQVQLGHGLATYSVFKNSEADVEIDTPNVAVHPNRKDGSFRVLVVSDNETQVTVRKGDAEISTPQGSTHLDKGQMIIVRGSGDDTQYKIADAASKDDWDRFNNDRDNTIRNAQAWSRTNSYYVGSEDLDAYGQWSTVPDYGPVWVPAVAPGWAPYRAGRWVWEPYWGWTWVSYEPWGWAPYHYGRWFVYGGSWVWWPGPVYAYPAYQPVWAPAYVSFFGFGNGFAFGVSFGGGWGSVGWLPIGPCDGYYPWYGPYRSHFNVVNVTNITNVYNYNYGGMPPMRTGMKYSNLRLMHTDDRVRGGLSRVDMKDFGHGRITAQPVPREFLRNGKMLEGNLPIVPSRESLRASDKPAAATTMNRVPQSEHFFTKNRPAAPQPFEREAAQVRTAIERNGHFTPVVAGQKPEVKIAQSNPAVRVQTGDTPGAKRAPSTDGNNNSGWRRFGQQGQTPAPTSKSAGPGQRRAADSGNSNWRKAPDSGTPGATTEKSAPASGGRGQVQSPGQRRAPSVEGNQDWRRFKGQSSQPAERGTSPGRTAPAARAPYETEGTAPASQGNTDWRRFPAPTQSPARGGSDQPAQNDSWRRLPDRGPAPQQQQRDSGNWRQSGARESGTSRPPLDMRQPIVMPRSEARPSGGYSGGGGSRPAMGGGGGRPSGGGGGGGRSSGGGGGGRSSGGGQSHSSSGGRPPGR